MNRYLIVIAAAFLCVALVVYRSFDPRDALRQDIQSATYELSLAKVPTKLITTVAAEELPGKLRHARQSCGDCTLIGVARGAARVELAPTLAKRWPADAPQRLTTGWVEGYLKLEDVGGAARMIVRKYTTALDREDLLLENPYGVLPAILPPDAERLEPRPANTMEWGLPLSIGIALLAFAIGRRKWLPSDPPAA